MVIAVRPRPNVIEAFDQKDEKEDRDPDGIYEYEETGIQLPESVLHAETWLREIVLKESVALLVHDDAGEGLEYDGRYWHDDDGAEEEKDIYEAHTGDAKR